MILQQIINLVNHILTLLNHKQNKFRYNEMCYNYQGKDY